MKLCFLLIAMVLAGSCATDKKPKFVKEKVCSNQSLKYLRNPRNQTKVALRNPDLIQQLVGTHKSMQQCYVEFKERTGSEEFETCLVVGIDDQGQREYFDFSSNETGLDQDFMDCAHAVTKNVPFEKYGKNYILIQSYQFYVNQ
ncbi:MAG TPA: hypothetical protein VNJ08_05090 [Bacteriovoracaceae bacterium]|nr:hypothetical protein [Bacteriovoracaceae bacterium]